MQLLDIEMDSDGDNATAGEVLTDALTWLTTKPGGAPVAC